MNNLKRVLSMALASVMLVGMMAVGASAADFTDADDIQYVNAVETLVALNVINGKEDGSYFDPQGDVTRAEMAKMISVAMNGGVTEPTTGTKGTPTFTDIKDTWAEAYIEFCADLGIISGRGDGTFAPGDKVTGLEATKMVLTALGYEAEAYQLTGEKWAARTNELALQAKPSLYETLGGVSMTAPASREVAAQLIWNGLQNNTRTKNPSENTNNGEVTNIYGKGEDTMLYVRYGARIWVGTYQGNYNTGAASKEGEVSAPGYLDGTPANSDGSMTILPASFPTEMGIENIGEQIKVIFKDGGSGNVANRPDAKDTIYGVFNTGSTPVLWTTNAMIKDNWTDKAELNIDGTKYAVQETGITLTPNYYNDGSWSESGVAGTVNTDSTPGGNSVLTRYFRNNANGDPVKFVFNEDNEIKGAYLEKSVVGVVTAVSSTKVTISGLGSLTIEDNDIYSGVAVNDVVIVKTLYAARATDDEAYSIVTKADVVSGTLDSFDANTVTIDGSEYGLYKTGTSNSTAVVLVSNSNLDNSITSFKDEHIGEDFDLYLVNGYVGAAVQTSEGSNNYSVIVSSSAERADGLGDVLNGVQIVVMDAQGVRRTLTVSTDSKIRVEGSTNTTKLDDENMTRALVRGSIVTWTLDRNNDAIVVVEAVAKSAEVDNELRYSKDTKVLTVNGKTYSVAADAALFAYQADGDEMTDASQYKAYNLRTMGTNAVVEGATYSVVVDKDNVVKAVFLNSGKKPTGATDNTVYGIVTSNQSRYMIEGVTYARYTVAVNEDTYVIYLNSDDAAAMADSNQKYPLQKGAIVKVDPTSDNIYTKDEFSVVNPDTSASIILGYSKEYSEADGTVTIYHGIEQEEIDGPWIGVDMETYAVDDRANVFYVDQDSDKGTLGAIGGFDTFTGAANIILITETNSEGAQVVTAIIYEVSGALTITNSTGL